MVCDRTTPWTFSGILALIFAASAAATIAWSVSMSAMGGMPMPGGWTKSMTWMMPGQTWLGAIASFLGIWLVMMVAMMSPSLAPMLSRYRAAVRRTSETRLGWLTAHAGAAYFLVWAAFGLAAFPLGVALANGEMRLPALARADPGNTGVVVLIAGASQFCASKAHQRLLPGGAGTRPDTAGGPPYGLVTRPAPRPPLWRDSPSERPRSRS